RLHPGSLKATLEEHLDDRRTSDLVGIAGHHDRYVEATGAARDHAERAARRRVRVGADHHLARLREALDVDVVADSVAGPRVLGPDASDLAPRARRAVAFDEYPAPLRIIALPGGVAQRRAQLDPISFAPFEAGFDDDEGADRHGCLELDLEAARECERALRMD